MLSRFIKSSAQVLQKALNKTGNFRFFLLFAKSKKLKSCIRPKQIEQTY